MDDYVDELGSNLALAFAAAKEHLSPGCDQGKYMVDLNLLDLNETKLWEN